VRRVTDVQARYIAMFYGDDVLAALRHHAAAEHHAHPHSHGHAHPLPHDFDERESEAA
jgi:hypothetical protein